MSTEKKAEPQITRRNVLSGLAAGAATLTAADLARACTEPTPTPQAGVKPIYVFSPLAVSDTVLAAYNATKTYCIYQSYIPDSNRDGRWEGKSSNYSDRLSKIPFSFNGAVNLDWEAISNCTYGARRMPAAIAGYHGESSTTIATAQAEALRALNAWKQDRPNTKWGFYWTPNANSPINFLSPSSNLLGQATKGRAVWSEVDCIFPRHYCSYVQASTTSASDGRLSKADLKTISERMAVLALQCAESGNNHAGVYPFISGNYYGSNLPSLFAAAAPNEWVYWHTYYFCQTSYNGRKAAGVHIWDGSSASPLTEARLKAIYQGLNGLPYDPNMPRPAVVASQ